MCRGCGKAWTAIQLLWSTVYIICGSAQLIAGIFFMISIPSLHLSCNMWTGTWNIVMGIGGGMLACLGRLSPRRQEILLYISVSVLTVNLVNIILCEWGLYFADLNQVLRHHRNRVLIDYACFATRVAAAVVLLVSFFDGQFAFCSMQTSSPDSDGKARKRKTHGSHEQVSDIEYIIPRPKSSKSHATSVCNAYSQSWVFETDTVPNSNQPRSAEAPYLKILENGSMVTKCEIGDKKELLVEKPVVHVEEASDDSGSNSDRKLGHMRSFSRSVSPILISPASSHASLNHQNQAKEGQQQGIYDCLETIYRSRLNSGSSDPAHYQAPQTQMPVKRVESVSPNAEKGQYACLMKELQKAIVNKKEPVSPVSNSDSTTVSSASNTENNKTQNNSTDTEFSKELEAALQLIQDLESPNTVETPSTEPKSDLKAEESRPLSVWQNRSDSEKTLNAVGSLAEMGATSPLEFNTFKPANGKIHTHPSSTSVVIRYPESQSTSGYSSPTISNQTTPSSWSTTSSLNGSSTDIIAYSIHNAQSSTVISLYSPQSTGIAIPNREKSVTLVNVNQDQESVPPGLPVNNNTCKAPEEQVRYGTGGGWNVKSLLRKNKRQNSLPKLCPELEGAIVKSESLAYLSELELLARHKRNKEIQREIEERVIQQLCVPRTESNC